VLTSPSRVPEIHSPAAYGRLDQGVKGRSSATLCWSAILITCRTRQRDVLVRGDLADDNWTDKLEAELGPTK
jgi:hypothetical protein